MRYFDIHTHKKTENAIYNMLQSENYEGLFSVGIHPWYINNTSFSVDELLDVLENQTPVAIGECGLDKVVDVDFKLQEDVFKKQIELATQFKKPLIIHCVRAYQECLLALKGFDGNVLFHGFNKGEQLLSQVLKRKNIYVSVGEKVFDERFRSVIKQIPLDRVFLESDDSVRTIESIYIEYSKIQQIPLDELMEVIEVNRQRFFS